MKQHAEGEQGFILVMVMTVLLLLMMIGILAMRTSSTEVLIAGNEKFHKETFYSADSGVQLGAQLVEENVGCPGGFAATDPPGTGNAAIINNLIYVVDLQFSQNDTSATPSDTSRDLFFPANYVGGMPHTNLNIGGLTATTAGSGLQMVAGYEGKGKGAAAGGGHIDYDINSQHVGTKNTESVITARWQHMIGMEASCRY